MSLFGVDTHEILAAAGDDPGLVAIGAQILEHFLHRQVGQFGHEALIKAPLGEELIGPLRRDGTAIEAREHPSRTATTSTDPAATTPPSRLPAAAPAAATQAPETPVRARKRGRPRRSEARPPAKVTPIQRQRQQTLTNMLEEIPSACDRGTKGNAQGDKTSENGDKRHLDTADCGVPITAQLSSASMHDSLAAIPLSLIRAERVTHRYELKDAAYCRVGLREYSRSLGHVPRIDHRPRRGENIEFDPAESVRYNERTAAERNNARLKDEFGGRTLMVKARPK